MKINEVEQLLGVSKANIRFYEKQKLLSPQRMDNGYRRYSPEDVERLQEIVILRKLGISVEDIGKILSGELSFQTAIQNNIVELEEQIEQLEGALALSRQLAAEQKDELDLQRYWDIIRKKEAKGEGFVDVALDYWGVIFRPIIFRKFGIAGNISWKKSLLRIALICGIYSLVRTFVWRDGDLLSNFFYWPMIISVVAVITFSIFWLGKHCPKAASVLSVILFVACGVVLGGILLLLICGLLHALF